MESGRKSKISREARHIGLEVLNSKLVDPPRPNNPPNEEPLPSSIFLTAAFRTIELCSSEHFAIVAL